MKNNRIHINNRSRKLKRKVSTYVKIKQLINKSINLFKKFIFWFIGLFRKIPSSVYSLFGSLLSVIWSNKKLTASLLGLISAPLLSWYLKINPLDLVPKHNKPTVEHVSTNKEPKRVTVTNIVTLTNTVTKEVTVTNTVVKNIDISKIQPATTNVVIIINQESTSTLSNKFRNRLGQGQYIISDDYQSYQNNYYNKFPFFR
jgi:hypothetical protein